MCSASVREANCSGIDSAPLASDFSFKTTPFDHQRTTFYDSRDRQAWALLLEMGCGKTKIAIDTCSYLFQRQKIEAVVVVAPKGVYSNWVNKEIPAHCPDDILERGRIFQWSSNKKGTKKFKEELKSFFQPATNSLKWFICNIDAVNTDDCYRVIDKFLSSHKSMMIVDESSFMRNPKTSWTKRLIKLGKLAKYRRALTGTPIGNAPLDIFPQMQFLDEKILDFSSFYAFRNRYAITKRRVINGRSFDEITGFTRLEELHSKIQKAATILRKEECLTLPPKLYQTREFDMSPAQQRAYDQLRTLSIAELAKGEFVTAELALTKLLRLHQIACGFVRVDGISAYEGGVAAHVPIEPGDQCDMFPTHRTADGEIRELDPLGGPRLKELLACLEEVGGKALIWANYIPNIEQVASRVRAEYGAMAVATMYGATSQDARNEAVTRFQDPKDPLRFIVGHPKTGGYGLTLTEAKTVIYFSNNYSLETRLQSEDRAHRIGQTNKVVYIDIVAKNTVDEKIIKALHNKEDLLKGLMNGGWRDLIE